MHVHRHLLVASATVSLWLAAGSSRALAQAAGQPLFAFQATKEVQQVPGSPMPAFPAELKTQGVQGQVLAQFVVDTTGRVEPGSFRVLRTTDERFSTAVREAAPGLLFVPAEITGRRVRQIVQQPFIFAITGSASPVPEFAPLSPPPPRPGSAVSPAAPSVVVQGWIFAQQMTVDSGTGRPPVVFTMRHTGSGNKLRSETSVSSRPVPGGSVVTILDGDAKTTTMVMPILNMATTSRTPAMPQFVAPTFGSGSTRTELLGAGDVILGMPTTRVRISGSRSISQSHGTMTCIREAEVDTTIWRVADPAVSLVQLEMIRGMGAATGTLLTTPEMVGGFPIRPESGSVVRTRSIQSARGAAGAAARITTTTEVTEFRAGDIDAALFAVPAGYQVQDMSSFMSGARGDSLMRVAQDNAFWRQHDSTAVLANGAKACVPAGAP